MRITHSEDLTSNAITINSTTFGPTPPHSPYVWFVILSTIAIILTLICILACFKRWKSNGEAENLVIQSQIKEPKVTEKNDTPKASSNRGSSSTSPYSTKTPKCTLIFKKGPTTKLIVNTEDIQPKTLKSWKSLDVCDVGFERRKSALSEIEPDGQAVLKDKSIHSQDKPDLKRLINKIFKEPPQITECPPSTKKPVLKMGRVQSNDASFRSSRQQTSDQQALNVVTNESKEKSRKNKSESSGYFTDRTKLNKSSA